MLRVFILPNVILRGRSSFLWGHFKLRGCIFSWPPWVGSAIINALCCCAQQINFLKSADVVFLESHEDWGGSFHTGGLASIQTIRSQNITVYLTWCTLVPGIQQFSTKCLQMNKWSKGVPASFLDPFPSAHKEFFLNFMFLPLNMMFLGEARGNGRHTNIYSAFRQKQGIYALCTWHSVLLPSK